MFEKSIAVGTGDKSIKYLSQLDKPDELFGVFPLKNYISFTAVSVPANEIRMWKIEDSLEPIIMWIYTTESVQQNREVRWVIKNELKQIVFDVPLKVGDFTELGNSIYWRFPEGTVIDKEYEAYLICNFDYSGLSVNCINSHRERSIEGRFTPSI